ncbi:FAD-dependent monooxygenase [Cytophagales bacterium RKSG123]|nr:FAD-dependent monooxygenase [Xanthovirga aplysinae]
MLGSGLVGSLLAGILSKKGYKVNVFEKREDSRIQSVQGGRSINLALSRRGWKALQIVGVEEKVRKISIPMKGRMMHDENGNLGFQPYGKEGEAIYSVSRSHLNEILNSTAERWGASIYFGQKCQKVDFKNNHLLIKESDGTLKHIPSDLIVGADGAFSSLRKAMQNTDQFNYSQFYLAHGYKELCIPPDAQGNFALEPHALHIWPRGQYMLIALPNLDKSFTCTLFFPFHGEKSFDTLSTPNQVEEFFAETFPDALPLMPTLKEDFFNNPTCSLVTIKCYPWSKSGNEFLIGDAAHAIVPFYGQGMNAGFEDCRVLSELMDQYHGNWPQILDKFQESRKIDADAISELALQNFIEMRDKVADKGFLLRKKIEAKLHQQFPEKWIPLYSMVTFSDLRYSEALSIGKKQEKIMDEVMKTSDLETKWESLDFSAIVKQLEI